MDNQDLQIINEILNSQSWLRLVVPVARATGEFIFTGKIEIPTEKGELKFDIELSQEFPLGKLNFICRSHEGYPHMMHSGLLCLKTAATPDTAGKMILELERLRHWVDRYFINGYTDTHFEYYIPGQYNPLDFIFAEDASSPFPTKDHGNFQFFQQNHYQLGTENHDTFVALNLGGRTCKWSQQFIQKRKVYKGIWLTINQHPVKSGRRVIENWSDLLLILSPIQTKYLYDEHRHLVKQSPYSELLLVALGYEIPNTKGSELHWDAILLPTNPFPYIAQKTAANEYTPVALDMKIEWCKSHNASFQRLFGRGALSNKLTDAKILVIGAGAIGSQLSHALVRGGCLNITVCDSDDVEPGNVSRGMFSFTETIEPKIWQLGRDLQRISPYLYLNIQLDVEALRPDSPAYPSLAENLSKYDFIFDCSTNKPVSIMLDSMALPTEIVNISISNEANQLVVITGHGNIHTKKSNLFNKISPGSPEPFYVATGCFHPTFQASYADIACPLMMALNELNLRLENSEELQSFYIERSLSPKHSLMYSISYEV